MAGLSPTSADVQYAAGQIAQNLKKYYTDAVSLNEFLLRTSDADLITLGISQEDITILKTAFADLAYQKIAAFDSSTAVRQLWGLGI